MEIFRHSLIEGAKKVQGIAIIIDVFRAFTTAAYVLNNGAICIIPIGRLEKAFELKRKHPNWILMGERDGRKLKRFDYGNSPFKIRDVDFIEKTVIMTTSSGTQGIVSADNADLILLGSFVTASATIRYVRKLNPEIVSFVAMGNKGLEKSAEDELCAVYLENLLKGKNPDFGKIFNYLSESDGARKFFDDSQPQYCVEDFYCALDLDRFDFALGVRDDKTIVKLIL